VLLAAAAAAAQIVVTSTAFSGAGSLLRRPGRRQRRRHHPLQLRSSGHDQSDRRTPDRIDKNVTIAGPGATLLTIRSQNITPAILGDRATSRERYC
jgi:hypothetical protein